jgi:hypothetical protein
MRTFVWFSSGPRQILRWQQSTSGFTRDSAVCACDAVRIAMTR